MRSLSLNICKRNIPCFHHAKEAQKKHTMYPVTGASGGAMRSPWPRIPAQLVSRDPCHSNILNTRQCKLVTWCFTPSQPLWSYQGDQRTTYKPNQHRHKTMLLLTYSAYNIRQHPYWLDTRTTWLNQKQVSVWWRHLTFDRLTVKCCSDGDISLLTV